MNKNKTTIKALSLLLIGVASAHAESLDTYEYVKHAIVNGGNNLGYPAPMPSRTGLYNNASKALISDEEIEAVARYVANGFKGDGAVHYKGTCFACHGANGEGVKFLAPSLRKLPADKYK